MVKVAEMMRNVLVVDSDQAMLQTLTGILKSQGGFLNVFSALNTKQAIDLLAYTHVDIVITAIRLPKVDGFRLVAKLTKEYPSIKVIIMTRGAHPLLRASIKRFPNAVHLDQAQDISMLTKRVFTELQIDYGGHVRGIHLSSFLQMMELERCSCTLRVSCKNLVGSLWIRDGEVVAAKSPATDGKAAALEIIAWKNVFIDIDYAHYEIDRQISVPLMMLILESGQLDDEQRSTAKDNREGERYELLVALDYDVRNMTRQCSLRDISLSGAYIETDLDVEQGENITLLLSSPKLKSSCSLEASVVRRDSNGAGVRFLIESPGQQQLIKTMIDSCISSGHLDFDVPSPTQVA